MTSTVTNYGQAIADLEKILGGLKWKNIILLHRSAIEDAIESLRENRLPVALEQLAPIARHVPEVNTVMASLKRKQ